MVWTSMNISFFAAFVFLQSNHPIFYKARNVTLITDDYPAYVNMFTKVFGEVRQHVLCRWHLRKNWKENNRTKNGSSEKSMAIIEKLIECTDEEDFNEHVNALRKYSTTGFF